MLSGPPKKLKVSRVVSVLILMRALRLVPRPRCSCWLPRLMSRLLKLTLLLLVLMIRFSICRFAIARI